MKKQDSPGWIGTSPRVTAQRNSLAGRIGSSTRPGTTHNADTGDKKQPQPPPADPHVSNRRRNPLLIWSRGAGTTAPKRASIVQDPTPQCSCTHTDHLTAWRTPSLKQPNARGPRRIRRWTPSRVRGDLQPAALSYGPPWAHYLGGYQDRLLGRPWDYSACATRRLMAWGARTTAEEYSDRKLYMSRTV
jgi:hypothetical protein